MTKELKSATSNRTLDVIGGKSSVDVYIHDPARGSRCIELNPADAPAFALDILEAGGFGVDSDAPSSTPMGRAIAALHEHIRTTAQAAKEAVDREALEAEARKLWESQTTLIGRHWTSVDDANRERWIIVARAAREIHGTKS